jgi:hypothetical protein
MPPQDKWGIFFMLVLFGAIIALSVYYYIGSTLAFVVIMICVVVFYIGVFVVRPSNHFTLNKYLSWIFGNAAPIIATVGVAITLLILGSTVVQRLVISGIAVVACWLILLPDFLRREFGRLVTSRLDTGVNPPWTDIVYGSIGVILFIGALVMQHYLVDNAAPESE